jgi:hypothetical protein
MLQVLFSLILVTTNVFCWSQHAVSDRVWRNGTYRGLTVGRSTRAHMLRVLGKPLSSSPSADQDPPYPVIWNDYGRITGEVSGTLAVEVDKRNNRIVSISVSPDRMTKDEVIRLFGNDYLLMGYEFCKGMPIYAEVGPVYESPNNSVLDYVEYRSRGIAVHLDHKGMVNSIYYVAERIGLPSEAGCKKAVERYTRKSKRR